MRDKYVLPTAPRYFPSVRRVFHKILVTSLKPPTRAIEDEAKFTKREGRATITPGWELETLRRRRGRRGCAMRDACNTHTHRRNNALSLCGYAIINCALAATIAAGREKGTKTVGGRGRESRSPALGGALYHRKNSTPRPAQLSRACYASGNIS